MSYKHHGNRVITRDKSDELPVISLDADPASADWAKQSWDLPPYKSPEFLQMFPDLEAFKELPIYNYAESAGLIFDDEWVADHVTPHTAKD